MSMPATTTAPVRCHQVPREAELVVMRVDTALSAEAVSGKLGLYAGHHLPEGGVALSLEHRVDVAAAVRPGTLDELGAALRVGLVPCGQVRVDDRRGVTHLEPPRCLEVICC